MQYLEFIINSGLLSEVKKTDYINAFEQLKITSKTYPKDAPIFLRGDLIDKLCYVAKGSVRREITYTNGDIHIISLYEQNTMFGLDVALSKTTKAPVDFISNEDTTVVFVSVKSIQQSDYALEMYKTLTYNLSDESIRMSHKIEMLSQHSLRSRILMYLNVIKNKSDDNVVYTRMNREQLAEYLCVNRSALSNELHKMKREGIIDVDGQKFTLK